MEDNDVFTAAKSVPIADIYTHYTGNEFRNFRRNVICPFPDHGDHNASMTLYESTNSFYCHGCRKGGSGIDFLMNLTGLARDVDAAEEICKDFNVPYYKPQPKQMTDTDLYKQVCGVAAKMFHKFYKQKKPDYFEQRGLGSLIDTYLLGYCPEGFLTPNRVVKSFKALLLKELAKENITVGEQLLDSFDLYNSNGDCLFSNRYIFPIRDYKGDVVGFSGRAIDPNNPAKYLNSKENKYFHKKYLLFNFDNSRKYSSIIIVEGYADALSLVAAGIPNVVATMGTAFTDEHFKMLKDKEIILSLDNDSAGLKTMKELCSKKHNLRVLLPNKKFIYKDFNEALVKGFDLKSYINKERKVTGIEYVFWYLKNTLDLSNLDNRISMYKELNALYKYYDPITKDYISISLQRLIKGKRFTKEEN